MSNPVAVGFEDTHSNVRNKKGVNREISLEATTLLPSMGLSLFDVFHLRFISLFTREKNER